MKAIEFMEQYKEEMEARFHLESIGVFGSHARGEERAESDLDVLVEFMDGHVTFDNYMDLKFYLEDHFKCKIDLVIKDSIREELKDSILGEVTYAA